MSNYKFREMLLASTVIAGMSAAAPAFAQETSTETPPAGVQTQESAGAAEETSGGDIVVTGTLIKNPNLIASSPVQVVGQEELQLRQTISDTGRDNCVPNGTWPSRKALPACPQLARRCRHLVTWHHWG